MMMGVHSEPDPEDDDTQDETASGDLTPATLTGPASNPLMTPPSQEIEPELSTDAHAPMSLEQVPAQGEEAPVHSLLIIEDDPWDAKLLEALLQGSLDMPVAFTHAGNLEDGIKEIHGQRVQLILTDLQLPDSAASETMPRLHEAAPGVPVIVLSGYADDELQAVALGAGALRYLVKGDVNNHAIITEIIAQLDELPELSDES